MNFCENCGHEINAGQKFCENCGSVVEEGNTASSEIQEKELNNVQPENKQSAPKKTVPKGVMVTSLILAVLVIGGYFTYQYGKDYYSRRSQIERIVEVLVSKDYENIASMITVSHNELEIDEESIEPFVNTYLDEVDEMTLSKHLYTDRQYEALSLKTNGSYFFLFDKYELALTPAFINLTTNMENVALSINDEEIIISDSDDFSYPYGPLVPGEYSFKAVTEINGHELLTEEERYVNAGQDDVLVDLPIHGLSFTVESNLDDPFVYVDDKEIGQLQNGYGHFGPFGSLDGSEIQLRKEESFGELKTSSSTMSDYDDEYYYLTFEESLDVMDAENALGNMYLTLTGLTQDYYFSLDSTIEKFGNYFYEGVAYDELRPFYIDYAERQRDNEEVDRTTYEVELSNFEQVGMDEYTVELEVNYITEYDWNLDKEDRIRTFTYNVSLIADDAVRDTWGNGKELFINGFSNEELIYDSNA